VSSGWAYSEWDRRNPGLTGPGDGNIIESMDLDPGSRETDWETVLRNDLEPAVGEKHPEIRGMKQALRDAGALGAGMSGSGPVCYGVFGDLESARQAEKNLKKEPDWKTFVVEPVLEKKTVAGSR